eukprot:SM000034S12725  [mRNA]  locus=s34:411296:414925:+ [translate_table: standard]
MRRRRRWRRRAMKRKASPGGGGGGGRTSSPPGSRFAACPACLRSVPIHAINAHLDGCPALNLSGAEAASPPPMPPSSPSADVDRKMTQSSLRRPCRDDGSREEGACPGSSTELIEGSEDRVSGTGKGNELLTACTMAAHPAGELVSRGMTSAGMHTSSQSTVVHADAEAHKEVLQQAIVEQTLEHPVSFPVFQRTTKVVHLIRHGHTGLSSADGVMQTTTTASLAGASGPRQRVFDIPLSSLGHKQAAALQHRLPALGAELPLCTNRGLLDAWMSHRLLGQPFHPEYILFMRNLQILTSPLTRALQTLTEAIGILKVPIEVKELHAEHVFCPGDVGRSPQILARSYRWLSFENIPEQWWYSPHHSPNDAELGLFGGRESILSEAKSRAIPPVPEVKGRGHHHSHWPLYLLHGNLDTMLRKHLYHTVLALISGTRHEHLHFGFLLELVGTHRRMAHCEILTVRL